MKSQVISAAAALTLFAGAAQAVTVQAIDKSPEMTITAGSFTNSGLVGEDINGTQISFSWTVAPDFGVIEFTLPGPAEITYDSFSGGGTSAFVLFRRDASALGSAYASGDTALVATGVTTGTAPSFATSIAGAPSTFLDSGGGLSPSALPVFSGIDGSDPEFVSGGTWVLGFYESAVPEVGTATFTISAVPLPASAWFLVAGVGAIAWRARRRAA